MDTQKEEDLLRIKMAVNSMVSIIEHFKNKDVLSIDDFWKIEENVLNKIKTTNK